MPPTIRIALVGDYRPAVTAHAAIPLALAIAAEATNQHVEPAWTPTAELNGEQAIRSLAGYQGIWCVPASPYANTEGALAAIRLAREQSIPFLGTCGGFQHAIIEYFRDVLGVANAGHEELDPSAETPVISRLSCSLVEVTARIRLTEWTRQIYGAEQVEETYRCNYGMNDAAARRIASGGDLAIEGMDDAGDVRIVRLTSHPFFVATLFQPERSALRGVVHPLIREFVVAAGRVHRPRAPLRPLPEDVAEKVLMHRCRVGFEPACPGV